jgi:pumilio RNA-binding family
LDSPKEEEKQKLNKEINKIIIDLCQDQYGNYVIQHILEIKKGEKCEEIFKALEGKIYEMSIHKFASNVIERCLHFGSKEEKDHLIDEIILKGDKVHNSLISLVKDKFGNYVVQKMIEYSDKDKRDQIINKILKKYLFINDEEKS